MKFMKYPSRFKKIITLFIIASVVGQHQVNCIFAALTTLKSVIEISYSVYGILNDAHDTYNKFSTASTQDVMDKVVEIAESLDRIGTRLEEKLDNTLNTLLRRIPLMNKIDQEIHDLNYYIARIDKLYNDFEDYVKNPKDFDTFEVDAITEASISRDFGDVRDVINKMHSLIVPGRMGTLKKSLLLLLSQETQEYAKELCDTGGPPQERIFELYSIIIMTEIRGYALTGFGYLQKSIKEDKDYMRSVKRLQQEFEVRVKQYLRTLKTALELTSGYFRRCDPLGGHVRGETFVEFERFIQTFVVQETALRSNQKCYADCSISQSQVHPGCDGFECSGSASTCYGILINCELQGRGQICEMDPSNARRYQFIIDNDGTTHGYSDRSCQGTMYYPESWMGKWNRCYLCRCTCVEDKFKSKSYHFISLRSQESDIDNNKVVTGVKFVMENKILHIQMQQGAMNESGTIVDDTTEWKDLEPIKYNEQSSVNSNRFVFEIGGSSDTLEVGKDIGILRNEKRRLFLDMLHAPDQHVVTGVKFAQVPPEKYVSTPFYLMIRVTKLNSVTGKLENLTESQWISYEDGPGRYREEINNWAKRNPLDVKNYAVNDETKLEIAVQTSSHWYDAAQTVLPLIDALPLYGIPPLPLSGIGLSYKAPSGDYGGFLTLILEGLNRASYIEVDE